MSGKEIVHNESSCFYSVLGICKQPLDAEIRIKEENELVVITEIAPREVD